MPWERPGCQARVSIWLQLCDLGQVTYALLCDPEVMVTTVITTAAKLLSIGYPRAVQAHHWP